jgi:hypothetical protein
VNPADATWTPTPTDWLFFGGIAALVVLLCVAVIVLVELAWRA